MQNIFFTKLSFHIKHHIYHQSNHSLSELSYLNNACNKLLVYYHIINHNTSNLDEIINIFIMTSQIQINYNKKKKSKSKSKGGQNRKKMK